MQRGTFMNHLKNVSIHTLDKYVRDTTVVDKRNQVAKYICYFLERNRPIFEVRSLLSCILLNEEFLNKVTIVNDHKFYNNVITLKRDGVSLPNEYGKGNQQNTYFRDVESIYLYLLSFDQEEDVRAYYPNTQIDVVTDEKHLLRENSRFAKAVRKKTLEKEIWPQYFEQRKAEITDMLLDEYIRQEQLFRFSKEKEHKLKAKKIISIIEEYSK